MDPPSHSEPDGGADGSGAGRHYCSGCGAALAPGYANCGRCGAPAPEDGWPLDPRLGTVIAGRYRLDWRLGDGGMGVVYRATRLDLDAPVAIKMLAAHFGGSVVAERFRREARVVARLQNPRVVRLLDFGETEDGLLYQVMEEVRGETLERRMLRGEAFTLNDVLTVLNQVCEGLAEAHTQGVVHRDLKPSNIMLVPERRGLFVKILDFGIAGLLGGPGQQGHAKLTQTGMVQGTPHYMSPEQVRGDRSQVDHRTDIYALGVVAYEMLAGAPPFSGDSAVGIMMQHVREQPRPLTEILAPGAVPDGLVALVHEMLAKDPNLRPQKVEDVQEVLAPLRGAPLGGTRDVDPQASTSTDPGRPRGGPRDPFFAPPARGRPSEPSILSEPPLRPPGQRALLLVFLLLAVALAGGVLYMGYRVLFDDDKPRRAASGADAFTAADLREPLRAERNVGAERDAGAAPWLGDHGEDPVLRRHRYGVDHGPKRTYEAHKHNLRVRVEQRPRTLAVGIPIHLDLQLFETDPDDGSESTASPVRTEAWFETFRTHEPITTVLRPDLDAGRFIMDHTFVAPGRYHLRVLVWPGAGKPVRLTLNFLVPIEVGGPIPPVARGSHRSHPTPWR